jgi:hypothetical protein
MDTPETEAKFVQIEAQLADGKERMNNMQASLDINTATTNRVEANTAELVAAFGALQGAMRVLEMIGRLAKPVAAIVGLVAACAGVWTALKSGIHIGGKP